MEYPEFREQEEELKAAAQEKFLEICIDSNLFRYFWYGVEFRAIGSEFADCPFVSGKNRGAYLAGMEWYDNYMSGNNHVSPERVAGIMPNCESDE
jgi:hypothetical protein